MTRAIKQISRALREAGFSGDIETGYAERIVASTDNSIYQVQPGAVIYPRSEQDIRIAARCIHALHDLNIGLCARGGGTGTNGQSLSEGLVLDCGRHLNRILEFDADARTVIVQPGVVLDQLNEFLQPHGLFFPIDISSSSRATLGGMVATDASGTGSLIYGKTGDHIQSLELVLADGRSLQLDASGSDEAATESSILQHCQQLIVAHRDEIERVFPRLNRAMSGYNLKQSINSDGRFNPCYLVAGAEGTLGIVSRMTLRLSPRPTHRLLTVLFYDDFERSLQHVEALLKTRPAAIEMLDDKVLSLARQDSLWFDVQKVLGLDQKHTARAALFIQHSGFSPADIQQQQQRLDEILQAHAEPSVFLRRSETSSASIDALWGLRKRAVGLLGRLHDGYQGIAFVEDSAVPAHNLVSYIKGFRQILDQHGLQYGMYGHADAGVLHVRPALDMTRPEQRALIRVISDQIAQLALDHQGVLWGEHGRGFRGEYGPMFFGQTLYAVLGQIKRLFDPYNLMNPGKLVTSDDAHTVIPLDVPEFRAVLDASIDPGLQQQYTRTLFCNGNGACFNTSLADPMCPSYKATRNKLHSPKGRAAMLREWARLKSGHANPQPLAELEAVLFDSLQQCLSCRSCTSNCPQKVDIPEYKSRFFDAWYARHERPLDHMFSRHFELLTRLGSRFPRLANLFLQSRLSGGLFERISRLHRLPPFSCESWQGFEVLSARSASNMRLDANTVILLRENYMNAFDREVLLSSARVLQRLGIGVFVSTPIQYGKLLHNRGMRSAFREVAATVMQQLEQYHASGARLVGVEAMARQLPDAEYADILERPGKIRILGIESIVAELLADGPTLQPAQSASMTLFPHCQEQTAAKASMPQWQRIFACLGVDLRVEQAGCCGMSGMFGHEQQNQALSQKIFSINWLPRLQLASSDILASGFSCRCQLKHHGIHTSHPIQALEQLLIRGPDRAN